MRKRNTPHTEGSLLELTKLDGDCMIWQGGKTSHGYGVVVYMNQQTTTHRVLYMLRHGAIPAGMEIDHTCNRRDCINPAHHQLVTHKENMQRGAQRRTTCRAGHPWDDKNTYVTTIKRKQGGTREQRYCRICRAKHQADLRKRREPNNVSLDEGKEWMG